MVSDDHDKFEAESPEAADEWEEFREEESEPIGIEEQVATVSAVLTVGLWRHSAGVVI